MEEASYTYGGAAKILDIAESKLRYWAQVGFVGPSGRRGGKPVFSFQDLVSVKAAKELVDRGFKAARDPQGDRRRAGGAAAPRSAARPPAGRVRRHAPGRRRRSRPRSSRAASACSTSVSPSWPTRWGSRRERPRRGARPGGGPAAGGDAGRGAARVRPGQAEGEGDVHGRAQRLRLVRGGDARRGGGRRRCARRDLLPRGAGAGSRAGGGADQPGRPRLPRAATRTRARDAFEAALALDPDQPEARFNLANLVLESGDLELAVAEFRRVLQADPEFADAHFNLAVALERLGGRSQARAHLEHYLALEPTSSTWADQARALIARLA